MNTTFGFAASAIAGAVNRKPAVAVNKLRSRVDGKRLKVDFGFFTSVFLSYRGRWFLDCEHRCQSRCAVRARNREVSATSRRSWKRSLTRFQSPRIIQRLSWRMFFRVHLRCACFRILASSHASSNPSHSPATHSIFGIQTGYTS